MKELIENYEDAAVYCGTYAKYNDGSIAGEWLKFSDYSDASEFMQACADLHEDEDDAEFMFQDFEYLPDFLYSESLSESDVEEIYNYLELCEKLEGSDWVYLWNEYQSNINGEDHIYEFDEYFFEEFTPMDAAQKATFGNVNWSHNWIALDGYANFQTYEDAEDAIEFDELIAHILENSHEYSL